MYRIIPQPPSHLEYDFSFSTLASAMNYVARRFATYPPIEWKDLRYIRIVSLNKGGEVSHQWAYDTYTKQWTRNF